MTWMLSLSGRAEAVAKVVKQRFEDTRGPGGEAEENAKNTLGAIAEVLCASLIGNPVVKIVAGGSAWHEGTVAKSQSCKFEFETLWGEFVE